MRSVEKLASQSSITDTYPTRLRSKDCILGTLVASMTFTVTRVERGLTLEYRAHSSFSKTQTFQSRRMSHQNQILDGANLAIYEQIISSFFQVCRNWNRESKMTGEPAYQRWLIDSAISKVVLMN